MLKALKRLFSGFFGSNKDLNLGIYGPVNGGKTTLANTICMDIVGEKMGKASAIPHETREIVKKEKMKLEHNGKSISMNLVDTPGIATRVDYKEFTKKGLKKATAKNRSKEATKGIVEAIKFLDSVDACLVVLDSTQDPYNQINLTILGNLESKKIPIIVVANKIDSKKAKPDKIREAFPQYTVVDVSAKKGTKMNDLYDTIVKELR